ncbi:MAG TPA: hypothetical protein VM511_05915 [Luteolibacter sp.]|nr:hypothetical protein [Luteolibacter sp.]
MGLILLPTDPQPALRADPFRKPFKQQPAALLDRFSGLNQVPDQISQPHHVNPVQLMGGAVILPIDHSGMFLPQ